VWPSARYPYVQAAIDFLVDPFGFEATTLTLGEIEGHYAHVELRWPEGSGGIMIGSTDNPDGYRDQIGAGTTWLYVVTQDPDALFVKSTVAGAEIIEAATDEEYGNRTFTVKDPWGHAWVFGTYPGA